MPETMNLRRLNEEGIARFTDFLDSLTGDAPLPYPSALLADPEATEETQPAIEVEQRTFGSRYAAAEYLYNLFKNSGLTEIERDRGLWAWLSLFCFEELCPPNARGERKPGERARWILDPASWRYYQHLLAGPYLIFKEYMPKPKRAMLLLCGRPQLASGVYREIAGRQRLLTNPAVMELATILYFDPNKMKLRPGSGGSKPGAVKRFGVVLSQFDCTWDLYSMDAESIMRLLPREFDRFKRRRQPTLFDAAAIGAE
jgi:hypothetical protein